MRRRRLIGMVCVGTLLAISGCTGSARGRGSRPAERDRPADLRDVPTSVTIDDVEYSLVCYLWRDYMPPTPPTGNPLAATVRVLAMRGAIADPELVADRLWVVSDADLWETDFANAEPRRLDNGLEHVARDGPKWSPGTTVDVIVRLRTADGQGHWLRAAKQTIERTF